MVGIYAGTDRLFMSSAHRPDPSHGTAGAGSLGRLTTNTALPALQHKAPVLGQGLEVKQDIVGHCGTGGPTVRAKPQGIWGDTLTTNSQQWPFPDTLPSYPPHKSMPGKTHVPTVSLFSPKWQRSLPVSSSLPVTQPSTQSGSSWGISQGHIPRPQKGAWQVAHILSSPTYILCQWIGIDPDVHGRRSQRDDLLTHKGGGHSSWAGGSWWPRWQLALCVLVPPQAQLSSEGQPLAEVFYQRTTTFLNYYLLT